MAQLDVRIRSESVARSFSDRLRDLGWKAAMNVGFWIIVIGLAPFIVLFAVRFVGPRRYRDDLRSREPRESVPSISDETDPERIPKLPSEWYEEEK